MEGDTKSLATMRYRSTTIGQRQGLGIGGLAKILYDPWYVLKRLIRTGM